jgi:hypothetical protein
VVRLNWLIKRFHSLVRHTGLTHFIRPSKKGLLYPRQKFIHSALKFYLGDLGRLSFSNRQHSTLRQANGSAFYSSSLLTFYFFKGLAHFIRPSKKGLLYPRQKHFATQSFFCSFSHSMKRSFSRVLNYKSIANSDAFVLWGILECFQPAILLQGQNEISLLSFRSVF